jgi:hypothetical protein
MRRPARASGSPGVDEPCAQAGKQCGDGSALLEPVRSLVYDHFCPELLAAGVVKAVDAQEGAATR